MVNRGILFLIAMVVLGIYVLPTVTARFAGSHTIEVNMSGGAGSGVANIICGQCHSNIVSELENGGNAQDVLRGHRAALENDVYTSSVLGISYNWSTGSVDPNNVCPLCHAVPNPTGNSHTMSTLRPCDDDRCHGNLNLDNKMPVPNATLTEGTNISYKLNSSDEVHSGWYGAMQQEADPYGRTKTDGTSDAGYLACLGCHSHVGVTLNVTRKSGFDFNLTVTGDSSNWLTVTDVGTVGSDSVLSSKDPDTKWD